jgi:hypothetical protein
MTHDEARFLLTARRPSGADDVEPEMAEALEAARGDAALAAWLDDQRAFDAAVAAKMLEVSPPADLRSWILAGRRVSAASSRRRWAWWAGVAAIVVGLASWLAWPRGRPTLASVQEQAVHWFEHDFRMDFDVTDSRTAAITEWLARQKGINFSPPKSLREAEAMGCKVFDCCGLPATLVCFKPDGSGVVHVFTVEASRLRDPPPASPGYRRMGAWNTATWVTGGRAYFAISENDQTTLARLIET